MPDPYGRLTGRGFVDGHEWMAVAYPISADGSVEMRVRFERESTGGSGGKWLARPTVWRPSGEAAPVRLRSFLGLGTAAAANGTPILADPSLSGSERYLIDEDAVLMGIPYSPFWLAVLLHEAGHAWQYRQRGNFLMETRRFMHRLGALCRSREPVEPARLGELLKDEDGFLRARGRAFAVFERIGYFSAERLSSMAETLDAVVSSLRDAGSEWQDAWAGAAADASAGRRSQDAPGFPEVARQDVRAIVELERTMDAIFERDATAYALRALRRIDRTLGTNVSHEVFRERNPDGSVFEGTMAGRLAESLSTYGARR